MKIDINEILDIPAEVFDNGQGIQTKIKHIAMNAIATADDGITIPEPSSPSHAVAGFNQVVKTLSGHLIEIDDTPGAERIREQHKSGTHYEIHPDGTKVTKIFGKDFYIILDDHNLVVGGNLNITVNGDANFLVNGNSKTKIHGNSETIVHGDMITRVSGKLTQYSDGVMLLESKENINVYSKLKLQFRASSDILISSKTNASLYGTTTATVYSDGNASINGTATRANSAPLGSGGSLNAKPAVPSITTNKLKAGLNFSDYITEPSPNNQMAAKLSQDLFETDVTYPKDRQ